MPDLEVQNNPFTSILMVLAADPEAIGDADPAAGQMRLVAGDDLALYWLDDTGNATPVSGSGLSDPMTTRGDIIIRNASNVTARLARGSATHVLTSDGTDVAWAAPTAAALTTAQAILTAGDVTLTQNVYTDILSVSLAAGTWMIWGTANLFSTSGAQDVSAAIYDSTNTTYLANGSMSLNATSFDETITLVAKVVLAGTATIKLQGTGSGAGGSKALRATQTNGTGNMATQINALKVA